jgi:hypothetical protein
MPILPSGINLTSHDVAVQKAIEVPTKIAKALGNVRALRSRCRKSSIFRAYMNLVVCSRVPFALIDNVCSHVKHLTISAVSYCQLHEFLHSWIIAMCVEIVRVI